MTPLTGNGVARLYAELLQLGYDSATIDDGLPHAHITDTNARIVYVDGRLTVVSYFEALRTSVDELAAVDNVIPLRPLRSQLASRRSG